MYSQATNLCPKIQGDKFIYNREQIYQVAKLVLDNKTKDTIIFHQDTVINALTALSRTNNIIISNQESMLINKDYIIEQQRKKDEMKEQINENEKDAIKQKNKKRTLYLVLMVILETLIIVIAI